MATHYVEAADAALVHLRERPTTMKRFVNGVTGEFFFQKRVQKGAPDWLRTATVSFPSGRSARELVANDAARLAWAVNLGVIDFNPWPCRVSCPLRWDEVPDVDAGELRLDTVPARLKKLGDPAADIDAHERPLDGLLELAARDEKEGLSEAPWPPHFRKQAGEPRRAQPSRARDGSAKGKPATPKKRGRSKPSASSKGKKAAKSSAGAKAKAGASPKATPGSKRQASAKPGESKRTKKKS